MKRDPTASSPANMREVLTVGSFIRVIPPDPYGVSSRIDGDGNGNKTEVTGFSLGPRARIGRIGVSRINGFGGRDVC